MTRLWQQIIKGEKGQALPLVLSMLVVGGLLIAPSLSYAATSLNAGRIAEENVSGVCAADAGVEYAMWCIKNSIEPPSQLPENVNQMEVEIHTSEWWWHDYTLYYGELVWTGGHHSDWLDVSGEMVEEAEAYKYTITVIRQPEASGNIKLEEVGVRLPVGYSYQTGSAASFVDNLSTDEPDDTLDEYDAHMLNWDLPSPHPAVSEGEPIATQTFYVTGEEGQSGDYSWVVAHRNDIGIVGEVTGRLHKLTATAIRPGDDETIATVAACVLEEEGAEMIHIISWLINPGEEWWWWRWWDD